MFLRFLFWAVIRIRLPSAEMGKAVDREGFAGRIYNLVLAMLSLHYQLDLWVERWRREAAMSLYH